MSQLLSLAAINKLTRRYVHPNLANKKDEYICPECNKDLILVQGDIRVHHFRHKVDAVNPCHHYSKPTEKQIHKNAQELMKTLLENKTPIRFTRECASCKTIEDIELPDITECSVVSLEHRFNYKDGLRIADVAHTIGGEIKGIYEICHTHKTCSGDRPEPWVEINATSLLTSVSADITQTLIIKCIRCEKCDDCVERERIESERVERERIESERLESERLESERLGRERIERERVERERVKRERLERKRAESERLERERSERERLESERKLCIGCHGSGFDDNDNVCNIDSCLSKEKFLKKQIQYTWENIQENKYNFKIQFASICGCNFPDTTKYYSEKLSSQSTIISRCSEIIVDCEDNFSIDEKNVIDKFNINRVKDLIKNDKISNSYKKNCKEVVKCLRKRDNSNGNEPLNGNCLIKFEKYKIGLRILPTKILPAGHIKYYKSWGEDP
jgi:hypothetical protein